MRLMVTGGAGYIGAITTRRLLDAGHEVVVVDTLENGRAEAVDPRARLIVGGVGDASVLEQALPGVDAVMHLAGYIEVAESQAAPGRYFRNNVGRPARHAGGHGAARGDGPGVLFHRSCLRGTGERAHRGRGPAPARERVWSFEAHVRAAPRLVRPHPRPAQRPLPLLQRGRRLARRSPGRSTRPRDAHHPAYCWRWRPGRTPSKCTAATIHA